MSNKKLNLTTRVNIQILSLLVLLMIVVTGHSLWISFEEKKQDGIDQLRVTTGFLAEKISNRTIGMSLERSNEFDKTATEQVLSVNAELQPLLANVLVPGGKIKYGVFSRQHQRLVAIGPNPDRSLIVGVDPGLFAQIHGEDTEKLGEATNSLEWYGAPVIYHRVPVIYDGQVVGHVFAMVNLHTIYAEVWNRAKATLFGTFIAVLIVIIFFQEVFVRLKNDLKQFAEEIIKGRARFFESELPEFTPLLKYISTQSEKMANLARLNTVGEMAASLGHEVRNPLTTIRGFLQHMSVKEQFQNQKQTFLLMIEELDRANTIITEFLSLAKNQALNLKMQSLNQVILDIYPLLNADALRNKCSIELNLAEIPAVMIDERCLRQMILNLVRNAIEAMPQGGPVSIGTQQKQDKALLIVGDQGRGIDPEVLPKLGIPFVTTKEQGTGLGVAICYRIAERHNAKVSVKTALNKGTAFTISFPLPKAK